MTKLHVDMTELWPVYEIREPSIGSSYILDVDEAEAAEWKRRLTEARATLDDFRDWVRATNTETQEECKARREAFWAKQRAEYDARMERERKAGIKPQRPGCTAPSNNARRR